MLAFLPFTPKLQRRKVSSSILDIIFSYLNVLLHSLAITHLSNLTSFSTLTIFKFTYPSHQILSQKSPYCLWTKFNLSCFEIESVSILPRLNCYWLLKNQRWGEVPLIETERGQVFESWSLSQALESHLPQVSAKPSEAALYINSSDKYLQFCMPCRKLYSYA